MGFYNQGRTDTYTGLSLKICTIHYFSILRNLTFPPSTFESLSAVPICFARVSPSDSNSVYFKIKKGLKIRFKKNIRTKKIEPFHISLLNIFSLSKKNLAKLR